MCANYQLYRPPCPFSNASRSGLEHRASIHLPWLRGGLEPRAHEHEARGAATMVQNLYHVQTLRLPRNIAIEQEIQRERAGSGWMRMMVILTI